jgi:hypothetical protein
VEIKLDLVLPRPLNELANASLVVDGSSSRLLLLLGRLGVAVVLGSILELLLSLLLRLACEKMNEQNREWLVHASAKSGVAHQTSSSP